MTAQNESVAVQTDMTFTKELRKATKDVHKMSDILVNAKFALALSDDKVWADGLLCFHEVYKFMEQHLPEELLPKELHRTQAFENDLTFLLGADWKIDYKPRESVQKYLDHLVEVHRKSPLLLFAYAYQMYMALMSGGQLLQKKRMIARKLWFGKKDEKEIIVEPVPEKNENGNDDDDDNLESRPMPEQVTVCPDGCSSTYFPEKISVLKSKLRSIMNAHYGVFDEEMKANFIEESRNVFIYNMEVVRSIRGVTRANLRKLAAVFAFVLTVYVAIKLVRY